MSRAGAVAYSDWAIGHWLDAARDKGLLEHTVVLIVGDHGARVYGRE
ncbi:MAG: sulfatase-like hydrolase/transferase, partial [Bryobacterales bacterium]|nr:sulfatase-like hydrolase/transferase [Bryobacterales bacterium]